MLLQLLLLLLGPRHRRCSRPPRCFPPLLVTRPRHHPACLVLSRSSCCCRRPGYSFPPTTITPRRPPTPDPFVSPSAATSTSSSWSSRRRDFRGCCCCSCGLELKFGGCVSVTVEVVVACRATKRRAGLGEKQRKPSQGLQEKCRADLLHPNCPSNPCRCCSGKVSNGIKWHGAWIVSNGLSRMHRQLLLLVTR